MPSVRPRISWLPLADLSQTPSCIRSVFSGSRRASAMISPITSSTTLRVLEYGALKTAMPRSAAASRSTWLVPMQKQPIATRSLGRVEHPRRDVGVGADPEQLYAARQHLDQLVLGEGAGAQLDLVAARLERLDGDRMDVLEEEDLHASRVGAVGGRPGIVTLRWDGSTRSDRPRASLSVQAISRRAPSSAASRSRRSRLRSAHRPEARSSRRLCTALCSASGPTAGPDRYSATDVLVQVCLGPAPVGLEEAVSAVPRDEHRFHPGSDRVGQLGQRWPGPDAVGSDLGQVVTSQPEPASQGHWCRTGTPPRGERRAASRAGRRSGPASDERWQTAIAASKDWSSNGRLSADRSHARRRVRRDAANA